MQKLTSVVSDFLFQCNACIRFAVQIKATHQTITTVHRSISISAPILLPSSSSCWVIGTNNYVVWCDFTLLVITETKLLIQKAMEYLAARTCRGRRFRWGQQAVQGRGELSCWRRGSRTTSDLTPIAAAAAAGGGGGGGGGGGVSCRVNPTRPRNRTNDLGWERRGRRRLWKLEMVWFGLISRFIICFCLFFGLV